MKPTVGHFPLAAKKVESWKQSGDSLISQNYSSFVCSGTKREHPAIRHSKDVMSTQS